MGARRYRIEDDQGPVAVVSLQERDRGGAHHPAHAGRHQGAGSGVSVARSAGSCMRPLARCCCATMPCRRTPHCAGCACIARQRHAALLVIDPCWDVAGPLAAALSACWLRACPPTGPGVDHGHVRAAPRGRGGAVAPTEREYAAQRREVPQGGVDVVRYDHATDPAVLAAALAVLLRDAVRDGPAPRLWGRAAPRHLSQPCPAAAHRGRQCIPVGGQPNGRELAHTLVHHSGDRAILFEAGEADMDDGPKPADAVGADVPAAAAAPRFAANFLLQWTIIRWAADSGFATYDMSGVDNHEALGLPQDETHPLWSLFRFKSQWGAQPVAVRGCLGIRAVAAAGSGAARCLERTGSHSGTPHGELGRARPTDDAVPRAGVGWATGLSPTPCGAHLVSGYCGSGRTRAGAHRCASRACEPAPGASGPGCTGRGSRAAR